MLRCPKCKSTNIGQFRMTTGTIWCEDCKYKILSKEKSNPFDLTTKLPPLTIEKAIELQNQDNKYSKKSIKVTIRLITKETVKGELNIVGYNRLSDFMEKDESQYLKVYNATAGGAQELELLINKAHIVLMDMT